MSDKIITILQLTFALTFFSVHFLYSQSDKVYKNVFLDGSESGIENNISRSQSNYLDYSYKSLKTKSYTIHYTPLPIYLSTFYDLQSNATPNEIWQDPLNPLYVHAAVMVLRVFGSTRYVSYVLSTDRGITWDLLGHVSEVQSGFPSIDGLSNGSALVTMQSVAYGLTSERSQVFMDLLPGAASFERFDPGLDNGYSNIWGRIIATDNMSNPVKWVLTNSNSITDKATTITGSSLFPPGSFSPWLNYGSETAEQYCLALGPNGIIGNAYIVQSEENLGDVQFRESKDGGISWSSVLTIYDADFPADSLGAFRGISMVYSGDSPCVTFEVAHISPYYMSAPGIYPRKPSFIYFWTPGVNGGVAREIAGPENIPFHANTGPEASYGGYTPLCRPAIGKPNSTTSDILFIAMNAATSSISSDSNVYYATYFIESYNKGNTWTAPERVTPVTPLRDYRYVSLSRTNSMDNSNLRWYVQMLVQAHDYAGAFAPNLPPGPSDFISMRLETGIISKDESVNIRDADIASKESFSLKENYPNPFNPETTIKFEIHKANRITLEVFNINGQKVATLIKNELISPGIKEVTFDGSDLSSGIYFYTLTAGEYRDTRRMLLIR